MTLSTHWSPNAHLAIRPAVKAAAEEPEVRAGARAGGSGAADYKAVVTDPDGTLIELMRDVSRGAECG